MGWLKDAWEDSGVADVVQNVIDSAVTVVTAPNQAVLDVLQGRPVVEAVRQAFGDQVGAGATAAEAVAGIDQLSQNVQQKIAAEVLGPGAADVVADINRIARPWDANLAVAAARAVEQFILTGKFELLNPLAIALAAEIQRCRNALLEQATPVPPAVKAEMPAALQPLIDGVRVIDTSSVPGEINLPSIAISHLRRATAVTLIDVIVFQDIPGVRTDNNRHLWCHEFHHVAQFAQKGVQKFCAEYIGEELSGFEPYETPPGNALEVEADYFACRYFPGATPSYIDQCPTILLDARRQIRREQAFSEAPAGSLAHVLRDLEGQLG